MTGPARTHPQWIEGFHQCLLNVSKQLSEAAEANDESAEYETLKAWAIRFEMQARNLEPLEARMLLPDGSQYDLEEDLSRLSRRRVEDTK